MYGKEYSLDNALTLEWHHFLKHHQILLLTCQNKTNILYQMVTEANKKKTWLCKFVYA